MYLKERPEIGMLNELYLGNYYFFNSAKTRNHYNMQETTAYCKSNKIKFRFSSESKFD